MSIKVKKLFKRGKLESSALLVKSSKESKSKEDTFFLKTTFNVI